MKYIILAVLLALVGCQDYELLPHTVCIVPQDMRKFQAEQLRLSLGSLDSLIVKLAQQSVERKPDDGVLDEIADLYLDMRRSREQIAKDMFCVETYLFRKGDITVDLANAPANVKPILQRVLNRELGVSRAE